MQQKLIHIADFPGTADLFYSGSCDIWNLDNASVD